MAVSENGSAIKQEEKEEKPTLNGRAAGPVSIRRRATPKKSFGAWTFNLLARLAVWYAIITSLFFCPSEMSNLTDESTRICKPYISARSYIQPYVQPYYDLYAGPYVEKARPYVNRVNEQVVRPASAVAGSNYNKYALPHVITARSYVQSQWEKAVLPQVLHAQKQANGLYDSNLAPHISKVAEVAGPYYEAAKDNAGYVHENHVLPAYESSLPYLQEAYSSTQHFLVHTGIPYAQHAWSSVVIFMDGTLWPTLKGLYGDNVKPQLVMISERITKYQQGRTLKAAMDEVDTPAQRPMQSSTDPAESTSTVASDTVTSTVSLEQISASAKASEGEKIAATPEQVSADLRSWQEKFARAADKGSEDLAERVNDLVHGLIESDIDGEGQGLATALIKSIENQVYDIKAKINSVVNTLPDKADTATAEKEVLETIRASGHEIRDRANAVRQWNNKFEADLVQRVSTAADSTLDVLDGIRDLGLQEIGLRWAWMDGITYKDWAKYHDLKKTFDEWRTEVRDIAMNHEVLAEARSKAEAIVDDSMEMAGEAAKELVRLRDVAKWKIAARDSSEDFDTRAMPAIAVSAASSLAAEATSIMSGVTESIGSVGSNIASTVVGSSQGTLESVLSQVTDVVSDAATQAASSASSGTEFAASALTGAGSIISSAGSVASESARSLTDAAGGSASPMVESFTSALNPNYASSASGFVSSVVDSVAGTSPGNILSVASSSVTSFIDSASSDSDDNFASSASISVDDAVETASSSASSIASAASSKVWGGAMAADIKGSMPILDDAFDNIAGATFSEQLQSVVDEAGENYAAVTKAVSEAMYGTPQGTLESVTSVASEQYASALLAASKALYPSPQGTAESMVSIATDKYSAAVSAARDAIYGTAAPATATLTAQASSLYADAVSRAQENYAQAKSVASVQMSGTPQPIHEQMFASIESAYSGSLEAASARLQQALSAGSQAYSSASEPVSSLPAAPTQEPMEHISSLASSRLNDAISLASAQYSSAKSAVGVTPTPAHEQYAQEAQRRYYEALGIAHERYSQFVTAASGAVYGSPTPVLSSMSEVASQAMYGTPTPAM